MSRPPRRKGAGALVVGGLDYGDDVVGTHDPVELQAALVLLGDLGGTIDSLGEVLNGPYPLIGPVL